MHFVGIDIAAETHVATVLDEADAVRLKPLPFTEGRGWLQGAARGAGRPAPRARGGHRPLLA